MVQRCILFPNFSDKKYRMNILYIGSLCLPDKGAAASRIINVSRDLRQCGHNVSFISWSGCYRHRDLCGDGRFRYDGFPYVITGEVAEGGSRWRRLFTKLRRGHQSKSILKNWSGKIDVIITYNNALIGWLRHFCKEKNIILVSDLTEWYSYRELLPIDWLRHFINMYYTNKRVNNKILISSYLNNFYMFSHNIIIPATCDRSESKWHTVGEGTLGSLGEFNGITLIYAGTPKGKDAINYAILAVHRLCEEGANLRLLILGCNKNDYLINNSSLLKKGKNLSQGIIFLGRVPQESVPSYYRLSDFMVLPRELTRKSQAGFATKFSESIVSGTPVVANLTSDIGNYLIDGETGFVVDEPSEEAIYRTLKNRVLPLSQEGIERMKANVRAISYKLDYHYYIEPLREFMNNLQ